ncbi:DEAD/DEAH box helicase, partial [Streptomyces sp. SID1034]
MSISSTDHSVLPENENNDSIEARENDVVEAVAASDVIEVVEIVESGSEADENTEPTVTFADLGLPEGVVRKLAQNGVTTPFPIQAATIPDALAGKDILGRGRTGSGKTL